MDVHEEKKTGKLLHELVVYKRLYGVAGKIYTHPWTASELGITEPKFGDGEETRPKRGVHTFAPGVGA